MSGFAARAPLSVLSPRGARGRLSIFIFHRVLAERDPLFPMDTDSIADFDRVLGWIGDWFDVLPLDDAVRDFALGRIRERAACITFDDGYVDNYLNALPVLESHELPATFFIATGFLDGGIMWNDQVIEAVRATRLDHVDAGFADLGRLPVATVEQKRTTLARLIPALKHLPLAQRQEIVDAFVVQCGVSSPADLMMTSDQVRAMRRSGMGIGAHTVSHPILASCDDGQAHDEISRSRDVLEDLIGERIGLFAYPNGRLGEDYAPRHANMVREMGFDAAVTTNPGASRPGDDLFQLRRFTPWDRSGLRFWLRVLRNLA